MSGAVSFVLGLLGLGAAAGVSAVQDAGINKKKDQVAGIHCWEGDTETLQMRRRVRDEWMSLHGGGPNCLGKWPSEYPTGRYMHSKYRYWFNSCFSFQGKFFHFLTINRHRKIEYDLLYPTTVFSLFREHLNSLNKGFHKLFLLRFCCGMVDFIKCQ